MLDGVFIADGVIPTRSHWNENPVVSALSLCMVKPSSVNLIGQCLKCERENVIGNLRDRFHTRVLGMWNEMPTK